jgi:vacuolar-type H+-ATPase subunit I/STV1
MAKKQKREVSIPIEMYLDWTCGITISKLREDLDALEKLGATDVEINATDDWGYPSVSMKAFQRRLETDEEFQQRVEDETAKETQQRARDLETLRILKEKYES